MEAVAIDPRDTQWEEDAPGYRVCFWSGLEAATHSSEWRVTDADVDEVLSWAEANAHGRYITIWVEAYDAGRLGMVRLLGWEPTRPDDPPEHAARGPWPRPGSAAH